MASLTPRTLKSGQIVWRVKWHMDGRAPVETFNPTTGPNRDYAHAKAFKHAVEAAGGRWPPNYVPGTGYVSAETLRQLEAEERRDAAAGPPFREHAEKWLASVAPGLESGSVGRYRRQIENHLVPAFGDMDVYDPAQICPEAIGRWVGELMAGEREDPDDPTIPKADWPWRRAPLSAKTVRNLHGLLFAIMDTLVDTEVPKRARNPCRESGKHLPGLRDGEGEEEMVFLSPEEVGMVLAGMYDPAARDLAEWLYGTGLRFSEATALQVRDFNVDGARPGFRVWRAWKQRSAQDAIGKNAVEDGQYYLGAPKTESALRRVALTGRQVDMVRPLLEGKRDRDLVFVGPTGGRWTHSTFYTGRWRPAIYRSARCPGCRSADYAAGIGRRGPSTLTAGQIAWCGHEGQLERIPRVHDLRHSHVAALIASGAHLLAISRRLGHKSIQITYDRYGHLLDEVEDDLVAGLDALMVRLAAAR